MDQETRPFNISEDDNQETNICPSPAMWLSVPDNNIDLVGEHAEAVWN